MLHSPKLHSSTIAPKVMAPKAIACGGALLAAAALGPLAGCGKKAAVSAPPKVAAPTKISQADLKQNKPNEAGAVMILMYHDFDPKRPNNDLNRTPDQFRKDLEMLYQRGYRPVTVTEFIENRMDLPPGKTPVVLTFDDSKPTQFNIKTTGDGQQVIDRNCAVGILQKFHEKNPQWAAKATFFVLPQVGRNYVPFGQPETAAEKFEYLLKNGYEIANHTSTHTSLRGMTVDRVQWELATAVHEIKKIAPEATMQVLALPYGHVPDAKAVRQALITGKHAGTTYKNKAVLRAAWRPVLSPLTRPSKQFAQGGKFCVFDPYNLERIKTDPRQAKLPGTLEYWIKFFDANPSLKYVSDGNLEIAAVPESLKTMIDPARAKQQGKRLQFYSLTGGGSSGKGGGGLNVE
ncbi:MAG: polysaccharide deacetylase family protein [Armatimonadota bacterium]|nr:polysaccharide deacetylase family protein [Armatimonadota bacterium]